MALKSRIGAAVCLALAIGAPARLVASPQFLTYEGRNAIHEGQGGEKKTVGGIEFWFDGEPPHRFQVLGVITDRRMKTGLYGMIRMSGLEPDIAKAAAAAGGDAVILQAEDDDLIGASSFGSAYGTGGRGWASAFGSSFAMPIKAHESRYIVVKYLPDNPGATPPAQTPAPGGQPNAAVSPAPIGLGSQPAAMASPSPATPPRPACGMVAQPDGSQKIVKC